ncbi:ChaC-like protein [Phlegmacium glaucopus]|nr:ChaC-like protein [Phlegmacium glaucopus]
MGSQSPPFIVFGYGSLIFKPPPHVIAQIPGFLKGYVRRFAQESHDHRGTPENPGRVVTLVHKEDWDKFSGSDAFPDDDTVWGIAYTIDPVYEPEVRDYLDYREKDGYTMETLDIHGINDEGVECIIIRNAYVREKSKSHCKFSITKKTFSCVFILKKCYVGRNDNPSFIGSEPLDKLAHRIWQSVGPSGPNKDYLFKLAESIRKLTPQSYDSHLHALEAMVRRLDQGDRQEECYHDVEK